jgi:hypothetical protein
MTTYPWQDLDKESTDWVQRVLLFYGPSGCGKTFLAGQLPRPLFLSCDPGTLGGAESARKFGVKHVKINSYKEMIDILPTIKEAAGKEFETVIVDSISYLARLVMQAILQQVNREIPRFEEWNLNAERLRRLINTIADLKAHIVFTAVDDMSKDEMTGKLYGGPALPGKLSKELPQACDTVVRLFTTTGYTAQGKLEVKYRYRVVPDDVWFAKDRTNLVAPEGEAGFKALEVLFTNKYGG